MRAVRPEKVDIWRGPPQEDKRMLRLNLEQLVKDGSFSMDGLGRDVFSINERIAEAEET